MKDENYSSATARLYRVVALKHTQNLRFSHNYSYDKIGNLVADKSEEIEEISWTMQGKVKEIRRIAGSAKPNLKFAYDGIGNRVSKTVIPKNSVNNEDSITTYYVRDAQGNILATYEKTKYKNGDEKFYLKEQYLYGSSRIGMNTSNLLLASNVNGSVEIKEYDGYFTKTVGNKRYELTNHLGNVLAVVSDKKNADGTADVVSVNDYYPFGMTMPGRSFNANSFRFSFNGKEDISELSGWQDYGERMYNKLTGRFDSPDPIIVYEQKYPELSSYQFANNSPIRAVDLDGLEEKIVTDAFYKHGLGKTYVDITKSEELKNIWNSVNREDKVASHKVYYGVIRPSERGKNLGGYTADLSAAAKFVKYYDRYGTGKASEDTKKQYADYKNLFETNNIDIDEILNSEKAVYGIFLDPTANEKDAIYSLLHEIDAHLKNSINGIGKTMKQEHYEFHNYKENPEILNKYPELQDGYYSPAYEDIPDNSPAGKIKKEVDKVFDNPGNND